MPRNFKLYAICGLLLVTTLCSFKSVRADDDDDDDHKKGKGISIKSPIGKDPLFEFNNNNGRYMAINIPFIWSLKLHMRGGLVNTMVHVEALKGFLYKVLYDQQKMEDGKMHGRIKIKFLGIKIMNKES